MSVPGAPRPAFLDWLPWEKLLIWGLFWAAVYALRHFFAIIFTTFVLTYIMRSLVMKAAGLLSPGKERLWLERLLSVVAFALLLALGYGVGTYLGPRLGAQGEALLARITRIEPEKDLGSLLSRTLGAYLFDREYGAPEDPRHAAAFKDFQERGLRVQAYKDFPALEASVESPFDAAVLAEATARIREELGTRGPLDRDFREWFLKERAPALLAKNPKKYVAEWEERYRAFAEFAEGTPSLEVLREDPSFQAKRDDQIHQQILDSCYENPEVREPYLREWQALYLRRVEDILREKSSSPYRDRFLEYYAEKRRADAAAFPYPPETYLELESAYAAGEDAFAKVLSRLLAGTEAERTEKVHQEFVETARQALVRKWMTGPVATSLKEILAGYAETAFKSMGAALRESLGLLLTIPVQGALSLLLSFFITFDIPRLRRAMERLAHSRAQRFYREIAPGLINLGRLMGRAFEAQGVIALANTLLTFVAMTLLDVHNALFLSAIVFVCSFVPVLGVIISSVPIAVMALVQPGGDLWLALKAVAAIIVIHFIETSALNPKIIGDMLHLHPVMVLAVLAIGEHYFGVWGLLLGVPVTVYVIRFVILDEGIPGFIEPARRDDVGSAS